MRRKTAALCMDSMVPVNSVNLFIDFQLGGKLQKGTI